MISAATAPASVKGISGGVTRPNRPSGNSLKRMCSVANEPIVSPASGRTRSEVKAGY